MSGPGQLDPKYAVIAPNTYGSYNSYILTDWTFCPVLIYVTFIPM